MADHHSNRVILLVGVSFYPSNTPRANRWTYFARELDLKGWRIRVISREFEGYLSNQRTSSTSSDLHTPSLLSRLIRKAFSYLLFDHHIIWAVRKLLQIARRKDIYREIDIVVAYGLPLSGILLGMLIARILGRPCVVEYGDPIDKNPAHRPTLLERIANKWTITLAKQVIVTNENYAEYASQVYGRQIEFLSPVASLPTLKKSETQLNESFANLGMSIKVFYAGMFYDGLRSGVPFIEALGHIKKEIVFVHAGTIYKKALNKNKYHNIGYLPQNIISHYLYWADVVLYFSNSSNYQTPSKVVEIAHLANVVLAIGNTFSTFESTLLDQTMTFYVSNKASKIEEQLNNINLLSNPNPKSDFYFNEKVNRLIKYNNKVISELDSIINKCIL
jgi:hypothetical protein